LHVAIFPALFTVILSVHLLLIQVQGISEPEQWSEYPESKKKFIPFFPNFVLKDVLLWLIVLNVLAILAVYYPWELGVKADPFAPAPAGIKPEWYFLFMYQSLKYLPAKILMFDGEVVGVLLFGVAGLLWFLVPLWDGKTPKGIRNKIINYAGIIAIIFIITMTILGVK
jgi:cytochrome b6